MGSPADVHLQLPRWQVPSPGGAWRLVKRIDPCPPPCYCSSTELIFPCVRHGGANSSMFSFRKSCPAGHLPTGQQSVPLAGILSRVKTPTRQWAGTLKGGLEPLPALWTTSPAGGGGLMTRWVSWSWCIHCYQAPFIKMHCSKHSLEYMTSKCTKLSQGTFLGNCKCSEIALPKHYSAAPGEHTSCMPQTHASALIKSLICFQ